MNTQHKPTLVILLFTGWSIRNYLNDHFISRLKHYYKIHLLLPECDKNLKKRIKSFGLSYDCVNKISYPRFLRIINFILVNTTNFKLGYWDQYLWEHQKRLDSIFKKPFYYFVAILIRLFSVEIFFNLLRNLDFYFLQKYVSKFNYGDLIDKLQPSEIFSPDIYNSTERALCIEFRNKDINITGAILSWDNLTYKGHIFSIYDKILVWNQSMKNDVINHMPEYDPENIKITGSAQFDFHIMKNNKKGSKNISVGKKNLLFSSSGVEWYMPDEPMIVEQIYKAGQDNKINYDLNITVRMHPIDMSDRFDYLKEKYPEITIQRPWKKQKLNYWWFTPSQKDVELYTETLLNSDLNINYASTTTLDAAILNVPTINFNYHLDSNNPINKNILYLHDGHHYKRLIKCNGVKVATNFTEMIKYINEYLDDPDCDYSGRMKMVKELCGKVDGNSYKRITEAIINKKATNI
tara:strand:- start:2938 stop:4329 length:1392 start_codon:yes stop_codon:yes gene_type:complete